MREPHSTVASAGLECAMLFGKWQLLLQLLRRLLLRLHAAASASMNASNLLMRKMYFFYCLSVPPLHLALSLLLSLLPNSVKADT